MTPDDHDVVVIGGGPAGLAAGTWAARYRRRVLVLDSGEQRNRWVDRSHGYLGSDTVQPLELLERARTDLEAYPEATVRQGVRAVSARRVDDRFVVGLDDGGQVAGLRLVLATGVEDAFPEVDRFFEHYGADVFHCSACDGYQAQGRDVVAIGWSEHIAGFALGLLDWASSLVVLTDGRRFEGDDRHLAVLERHGVPVIEDDAVCFEGSRGELRSVLLRSGRELACQLAFFSIAHLQRNDLARQLGCEVTEEGSVVVDHENLTTVDGVYAAGDLTPGMQLVQVAASKGAVAGVSAAQSIRGEPGASRSAAPAPDPEVELP